MNMDLYLVEKNLEAFLESLHKKSEDPPDVGSAVYDKTCFDCKHNKDGFCSLADKYLSAEPRFCEKFEERDPRLIVSVATVAKVRRVGRRHTA